MSSSTTTSPEVVKEDQKQKREETSEDQDVSEPRSKMLKVEEEGLNKSAENREILEKLSEETKREWPWKKAKKCAVMLSFLGKDYTGMQVNKGFKTIEGELLRGFVEAGAIPPEWEDFPQKGFFQRASRTDKGVSAAKMIVSLKILDEPEITSKINSKLPVDIRVQEIKRVTKNFNAKNSCDARTYLYLLPTYSFCPVEKTVDETYRITPDIIKKVNETMELLKGSHYFHNYTSGKVPLEPSSLRFITHFEIGEPFIEENVEFAIIKIKGQSFMLHQIRKMIAMVIAIVRGFTEASKIEQSFKADRMDVPRAPGLGLMLEEVHYERYNRKFGEDGMHDPLTWENSADDVESFKKDMIFAEMIRTELAEKSMMNWMQFLPGHTYGVRDFEDTDRPPKSPLGLAEQKLHYHQEEKAKQAEASKGEKPSEEENGAKAENKEENGKQEKNES